jgi:hypothetical protein
VTPDALLRWYGALVARKYDGSTARKAGRPGTKPDIEQLVMRMDRENPTWGYCRIQGGLKSLDHQVARSTIAKVLQEHGIAPAPDRASMQAPNMNAFAERFVRSIKSECLERMIFVGGDSLGLAVREFAIHYHAERPHQGLENTLICGGPILSEGRVEVRDRLGGLLKYYHREAA